MALTWPTLNLAVGIALAEHTIDFRIRLITTTEPVTAASKQRPVRLPSPAHLPKTSTVVTRATLTVIQVANQQQPTITPSCTKNWGQLRDQPPRTTAIKGSRLAAAVNRANVDQQDSHHPSHHDSENCGDSANNAHQTGLRRRINPQLRRPCSPPSTQWPRPASMRSR